MPPPSALPTWRRSSGSPAQATDSVKRAQAEKDFGKLVATQPAHKRPIIEATAPPLLRLSTAKGKLVGQAGSQAPDLIGLGYYLTALYKSAHNSQFANNGRVTADIAAVLSQIPDNSYAYISFEQVDSIDYSRRSPLTTAASARWGSSMTTRWRSTAFRRTRRAG